MLIDRYRYLKREELSKFPRARIELIQSASALHLYVQKGNLKHLFNDNYPNIEERATHLFIPINDETKGTDDDQQGELGKHWSLLVVSIIDRVAFHYDSVRSHNEPNARLATDGLNTILKKGKLTFVSMANSPQQTNSSDCGVAVCVIMKHLLLKRLLRADASRKISMSRMSLPDLLPYLTNFPCSRHAWSKD